MKLGKVTHTFLAERCFYMQLNGRPKAFSRRQRKQLVRSQLIRVLRLGGLVFSRLGWAACTTRGLCHFPGSRSEAVTEQSIYALANLGPCTALTTACAVLLCWVRHSLHQCQLWPYHANTQWQHCILKDPFQEINLVISSVTWCKHQVSQKQLGTLPFNEIPDFAMHEKESQLTLRSLSPKINKGSKKA